MDTKIQEELKNKLLAEKERLISDLKRFAKPTDNPENFETQVNELGTDREDNASETEEFFDNLALEDNLEKQLRDVDDALENIEKGTYGRCENCQGEISLERLKAYPAAKKCLDCSEK